MRFNTFAIPCILTEREIASRFVIKNCLISVDLTTFTRPFSHPTQNTTVFLLPTITIKQKINPLTDLFIYFLCNAYSFREF